MVCRAKYQPADNMNIKRKSGRQTDPRLPPLQGCRNKPTGQNTHQYVINAGKSTRQLPPSDSRVGLKSQNASKDPSKQTTGFRHNCYTGLSLVFPMYSGCSQATQLVVFRYILTVDQLNEPFTNTN